MLQVLPHPNDIARLRPHCVGRVWTFTNQPQPQPHEYGLQDDVIATSRRATAPHRSRGFRRTLKQGPKTPKPTLTKPIKPAPVTTPKPAPVKPDPVKPDKKLGEFIRNFTLLMPGIFLPVDVFPQGLYGNRNSRMKLTFELSGCAFS